MTNISLKFKRAGEIRRKIRILRKGILGLKSTEPYLFQLEIYEALEVADLAFVEKYLEDKLSDLNKELEYTANN